MYPGTDQIFWVPPISGICKDTNFKFGQNIHRQNIHRQNIHRVHRNKSPVKLLEIKEHGHIQGLVSKQFGKVSTGIVRESQKLSGHSYIRRIARLSL